MREDEPEDGEPEDGEPWAGEPGAGELGAGPPMPVLDEVVVEGGVGSTEDTEGEARGVYRGGIHAEEDRVLGPEKRAAIRRQVNGVASKPR